MLLDFFEMKYTSSIYTFEFTKKYIFEETYFKYASEFKNEFINLKIIL